LYEPPYSVIGVAPLVAGFIGFRHRIVGVCPGLDGLIGMGDGLRPVQRIVVACVPEGTARPVRLRYAVGPPFRIVFRIDEDVAFRINVLAAQRTEKFIEERFRLAEFSGRLDIGLLGHAAGVASS
jgi:hypothetical protein